MVQHNLVAYTMQVHPIRQPESALRLGWLDGDDQPRHELRDELRKLLAKGTEWRQDVGTPDEVSGRVLALKRRKDTPTIYGRIRVGGRGERSDITKVSGEEVEIWSEDEVSRPVFFWITAPAGSKRALVLTERIGRFGVRGAFWDNHVVAGLRKALPDRVVKLAHWYPMRILEEYLEYGEGLRGATLRKVVLEEDENKSIDDPARVTKYGMLDVVVKRRWRPAEDVMRRLLGRQIGIDEAIELLIPPEAVSGAVKEIHPDELILSLDLGDHGPRSISLTRDRQPRAGFPVGNVTVDEDGYAHLTEMARFAEDLQKDLAHPLGWG